MSEPTLFGDPPRYPAGRHDLGSGLHAWLQPNGAWGESNAGLVVGEGASLLVDTLWDLRLTRGMLDALAPLTAGTPITHVVNTHSDGDHWWGNELVPGAEILTSEASARVMAETKVAPFEAFRRLGRALSAAGARGGARPRARRLRSTGDFVQGMLAPFDFSQITLTPATRTFAERLVLDVGGREVELIAVGPAHTPGDLVVHVPDARTVFAADVMFLGSTPVMWAGPVRNWFAALDTIAALEPETVVPGHGPVTDLEGVRAVRGYWTWLEAAGSAALARGLSPAAAARELLVSEEFRAGPYARWEDPERIVVNLSFMARERAGKSGPISEVTRVSLLLKMAALAAELPGASPSRLHPPAT